MAEEAHGHAGLDSASLLAWRQLPAGRPSHTSPASWSQVLVRSYEEPATAEAFTTAATTDLLVVIQQAGAYRLQSFSSGRWRTADYQPGTTGVTAPGAASVLRWGPSTAQVTRSASSPSSAPSKPGAPSPAPKGATGAWSSPRRAWDAARTIQVHLGATLLAEVASALGCSSQPGRLPDVLAMHRPDVSATALALHAASQAGLPRLAGEALATALAAQLLAQQPQRGSHLTVGRDRVRPLTQAQLHHVVDFMHAHLAADIGISQCAREAGCSPFHFVRAFAASTGITPHRYLTRLRMERAAQLLRTSELSVLDVALACGYAGTSHFAKLFARHHRISPSVYRRSQGPRPGTT